MFVTPIILRFVSYVCHPNYPEICQKFVTPINLSFLKCLSPHLSSDLLNLCHKMLVKDVKLLISHIDNLYEFDGILGIFKLVQTCPNLSKLVQTCPNLFKLVPKFSNLVKSFPKMFKFVFHFFRLFSLFQSCPNLFKFVQTCSNLFKSCLILPKVVQPL